MTKQLLKPEGIKQKIDQQCDKCGSKQYWKSGFRLTRTGKKQLYQCKICGHKWREL